MTKHAQELEDYLREENDKWYAEAVAEQKAAIERMKAGQMSSLVPDSDDVRKYHDVPLSAFERSLLSECVRKEIESLQRSIKTYEEMLEVENSAAPSDDREAIQLFSDLCKKDVRKLGALHRLLG